MQPAEPAKPAAAHIRITPLVPARPRAARPRRAAAANQPACPGRSGRRTASEGDEDAVAVEQLHDAVARPDATALSRWRGAREEDALDPPGGDPRRASRAGGGPGAERSHRRKSLE